MRIDFDENDCVEFIEVLSGPYCEKIEPFMYGKNPFKLVDTQLLEFLAEMNNGNIDDHEYDNGYYLLNISVGIYSGLYNGIVSKLFSDEQFNDQVLKVVKISNGKKK